MGDFEERKLGKVSLMELALIRLVQEQAPKPPKYKHAILYLMGSCFYKSEKEISQAIGASKKETMEIMRFFMKKGLVEKMGCLYKPIDFEEISLRLK
ncbi:MAG: hypothetical protein JW772_04825 [Candidatus Diapherotrites archaeon]|nr:hypothetical protein [Candidatus Diapherotrites archaeon]